jgi:small multidrug resistance pump
VIGWMWLLAAIVAEVTATTALRATDGFARLGPSAVVVVGYALAFGLLSRALVHLPLGVSYAVWSGVGTVGAVLAGWVVYGERVGWSAALGVLLVVLGTAVLHAGHAAH